jgi:hypothetical protein
MLSDGAISGTFAAMLDDLWPPHIPAPDALTHMLLLQCAVRTAAKMLEDKFKAGVRGPRWDLQELPGELDLELQKLESDSALATAVFGVDVLK